MAPSHGLSRAAVLEQNPIRIAQGLEPLELPEEVVAEVVDRPGLHWPVCQPCNGTGLVLENNTSGVKCAVCKGVGRVQPTGHGFVLVHQNCAACLATMKANLGIGVVR